MSPGVFEIEANENFSDILKFANGFSKNINLDSVFVKRVAGGKTSIINQTIDELYSFEFKDNDALYIQSYKLDTVLIEGSVVNPGRYKLNKGTTLSQAIKLAGGYEIYAYPFGGYLENAKALTVNKISKDKLYEIYLSNLVLNSASALSENSELMDILIELKNSSSTGRIIAEFDLDVIANEPAKDTILENNDRIIIPQKTQQVYVQGEVSNSGAARYSPGKDINYYIKASGGVLDSADLKNIYVIHPNGETINLGNKSRLSFILEDNNIQLIYPGSIIYVPQKTNYVNPLQIASIWAPIISSLALSLTSLSVLNNTN
jgi:protein involved in polysaccharide export with SLBB domain